MDLTLRANELGYKSEMDMLQILYTEKQLSIFDISLKLGCSENTISRNMRKYGIPVRSASERRKLMEKKYGRVFNFKRLY